MNAGESLVLTIHKIAGAAKIAVAARAAEEADAYALTDRPPLNTGANRIYTSNHFVAGDARPIVRKESFHGGSVRVAHATSLDANTHLTDTGIDQRFRYDLEFAGFGDLNCFVGCAHISSFIRLRFQRLHRGLWLSSFGLFITQADFSTNADNFRSNSDATSFTWSFSNWPKRLDERSYSTVVPPDSSPYMTTRNGAYQAGTDIMLRHPDCKKRVSENVLPSLTWRSLDIQEGTMILRCEQHKAARSLLLLENRFDVLGPVRNAYQRPITGELMSSELTLKSRNKRFIICLEGLNKVIDRNLLVHGKLLNE
jgi:hypothetical protein